MSYMSARGRRPQKHRVLSVTWKVVKEEEIFALNFARVRLFLDWKWWWLAQGRLVCRLV